VERFEVYRYVVSPNGAAEETRYSLAPMKGVRYAGRDEPEESGEDLAGEHSPAGTVEAPDGSSIASLDPPILEIPGQGRVELHAIIGATEGNADGAGRALRWRPR
jgi:hypothetical protein